MSRGSLLLLKDLSSVSSIHSLLAQCNKHIGKAPLFIQPNYQQLLPTQDQVPRGLLQVLSQIYSASDVTCPDVDVRVLLPGANPPQSSIILSDCSKLIKNENAIIIESDQKSSLIQLSTEFSPRFEASCLGGTFDRIHAAHRLLLTEAVLLAREKLVIGLATGKLLESKFLKELILPIEARKTELEHFLKSIQSHLNEIQIVPIEDPFGPAATDPTLEVIVVSGEVEKAVPMINDARKNNKIPLLASHSHNDGQMVADEKEAEIKAVTDTVSSSAGRSRLLGTLLKAPYKTYTQDEPYVIGLTGMLASGKSSVCKRLEKLGAYKVDADKMGHLAYAPKTESNDEGPAYKPVIDYFGSDILDDNKKFIDRKKLGAKVFNNPGERKKLEELVWPAIETLCKKEISKAHETGHSIVVVEAAVLLEAGWENFVNEVWCCHVPVEESIKRSIERDGATEEMVRKRIAAQIPIQTRVDKSNVVISTFWEPEVTQKIVEKSWSELKKRLE